MIGKRISRVALALLLTLAPSLSGCGTGVYEKRFEERYKQLQTDAKWFDFYSPTRIPGVPITIRIPQVFKSAYLRNTKHVSDNGAIHPQRFQPPFLSLPGAKLTYEAFYTANNVQSPFYCYLAAGPADAELPQKLLDTLKKSFANAPAWETVQADGPGGVQIPWKKIRVAGSMSFDMDPGGGTILTQNHAGTFELWLHEANGYSVLVGWRIRDGDNNVIKLLDKAPIAAGTLTFVDPSTDPAPPTEGDDAAAAPAPTAE